MRRLYTLYKSLQLTHNIPIPAISLELGPGQTWCQCHNQRWEAPPSQSEPAEGGVPWCGDCHSCPVEKLLVEVSGPGSCWDHLHCVSLGAHRIHMSPAHAHKHIYIQSLTNGLHTYTDNTHTHTQTTHTHTQTTHTHTQTTHTHTHVHARVNLECSFDKSDLFNTTFNNHFSSIHYYQSTWCCRIWHYNTMPQ